MITIICSTCGTRNQRVFSHCRRCNTSLVSEGIDSHETARGTPTSVVLGDRWILLGPLPDVESSELWHGQDLVNHHQDVVIKTLGAAVDANARQRFVKDARRLEELNHPNLVQILDVIEEGNKVGYAMEYVVGQSLRELLNQRERLPVAVAIEIGKQALRGLNFLHRGGMLHGQITAGNIFLFLNGAGELQVKLAGVRCGENVAGGAEAADRHGTLVGMPVAQQPEVRSGDSRYLAPELRIMPASAQSDIYSLGICLVEAICGELPASFFAFNEFLAASASRENNLARITNMLLEISSSYLATDLTPELCAVFAAMLASAPEVRPASAQIAYGLIETAQEKTLSAQMVSVGAGTFFRGSQTDHPHARDEEFPMMLVHVEQFFMDKTPVTAQQFKRFLDVTGRTPPPGWTAHNDPIGRPHVPVVFVTWEEANTYARWAGKHLPTEAEWEKAARGTDGRIYPWGDQAPTAQLAWFDEKEVPVNVGQFPAGQSPYSALDMAGNVFEWVADWFDKNAYKAGTSEANPKGPSTGNKRVLRGGSFTHSAYALRCATRGRYAPDERRANHSFRCAWKLI